MGRTSCAVGWRQSNIGIKVSCSCNAGNGHTTSELCNMPDEETSQGTCPMTLMNPAALTGSSWLPASQCIASHMPPEEPHPNPP